MHVGGIGVEDFVLARVAIQNMKYIKNIGMKMARELLPSPNELNIAREPVRIQNPAPPPIHFGLKKGRLVNIRV